MVRVVCISAREICAKISSRYFLRKREEDLCMFGVSDVISRLCEYESGFEDR